jgi:antirestriction protein ArdC
MTTKTTNAERTDRVAETMTRTAALIIESIETGLADPGAWSAPWQNNGASLPVNVSTGATYSGGNLFLLWSLVALGASPYWGTFNQWRDLSTEPAPVTVRKGERAAAYILRPRTINKENEKTGEKELRIVGWSAHAVFHAGQVDGWTAPAAPARPEIDNTADLHAAFTWAAYTGAEIVEGSGHGAAYSPTFDRVYLPDRGAFTSAHGAWSTIAHELCHWTGHASRLNRAQDGAFGNKFGSHAYAAEELVAELGAAFTLAAMGRTTEPRPDHAQYLAHWLQILKEKPEHLWTIAGKASKAAGYLADRTMDYQPDAVLAMA